MLHWLHLNKWKIQIAKFMWNWHDKNIVFARFYNYAICILHKDGKAVKVIAEEVESLVERKSVAERNA